MFHRSDRELEDEYYAVMKRCEYGPMPDPEEIWELCQQLILEGYAYKAEKLGHYLPD